ncbi:MAG: hypothetical protein LBI49_03280 [Nocardiopsaceae bacterium]|nr:hypothetical protein [Nocardiopsaceae bacterium]
MGYVIGIDVGSQSVKAVLCSPEGDTVATATHPCSMDHPRSGWSEQDPAQWREGIRATVHSLLARPALRPGEVTHLGLACQVDGVVPVDDRMSPLRPAIIWLDRRAERQARELEERLGAAETFRLSGLNPDASHIAPKIMWLRDTEPEVYLSARLFPPVAGYLTGWLTGHAVQDHANASSTLLYDVRTREWSPELLKAADIDPRLLAPIQPAHELAGHLTGQAAAELGLPTSCQVVTGTGDDHAAALGAGVVAPGAIADVTGTAEPVAAAATGPVFDEERLVETHAHAVDGTLLVENPGFVSGGSTMWLARALGCSQEDTFTCAEAAPPGSDGVIFLPALSGATAPRWNDRMRGVFHGLSMNHDRCHLSRAVLEGCTYALRDITDRLSSLGLGGGELRVVGGGCRIELWLQVKADVTGLPVREVLVPEPTALGAAMLACVGAGAYPDTVAAAAQMTRLAHTCREPDPARAEAYQLAYARYQRVFDALEELAR